MYLNKQTHKYINVQGQMFVSKKEVYSNKKHKDMSPNRMSI